MTKEKVAKQIERAFADTPSPGREFRDISASTDDEGIVSYFRGRGWRGHNVKDLRKHDAALSLFTAKAFRYWLPAFMLAELEHPVEADVIAEGVAFHFTNSKFEDERLREFSQDELKAIAAFFDDCARRSSSEIYGVMFRKAASAVRAHITNA